MDISVVKTSLEPLLPWRDLYRHEMNCQIIHDSIHGRPGWAEEYVLNFGGMPAGYGSIAVSGPWKGKPTVFEFYVLPQHRMRVFDLFSTLLAGTHPVMIETQSNDPLLTVMLHTFAKDVLAESILYRDDFTTSHAPPGARFRRASVNEFPDIQPKQLEFHGAVEFEGKIAATGGILFHYNRPYGDIFMEVAEPFRRRGFGSYMVQELKRVCYERGNIPAARCNRNNIASRKTLQKAGFVPCANILVGTVAVC